MIFQLCELCKNCLLGEYKCTKHECTGDAVTVTYADTPNKNYQECPDFECGLLEVKVIFDDLTFSKKGETISKVMTFSNIYDIRLTENNTVALLNKDLKINTLISLDKIQYLRSEPMHKGHGVEFDLYGGYDKI